MKFKIIDKDTKVKFLEPPESFYPQIWIPVWKKNTYFTGPQDVKCPICELIAKRISKEEMAETVEVISKEMKNKRYNFLEENNHGK